ncbi:MAG: hypothetical protein LBJ08_08055 [Bifidobacteriaceae bacterium]|jgi:chromosome segregation ATPase|nr:hypothetical protein [Bifidobacteriaceae bacterium]
MDQETAKQAPYPFGGDLTYRAAAADRAAKITGLVWELETLRQDRDELARRVGKLERRMRRTHEKLTRSRAEVQRLRADPSAGTLDALPATSGEAKPPLFKRWAGRMARGVGIRA